MQSALLDTDILNEVLKKRNPQVVQKAAAYLQRHHQFAISGITWYEVVRGLREKRAGRQLANFDRFCRHSTVIDVTLSVLDRSADLWVDEQDEVEERPRDPRHEGHRQAEHNQHRAGGQLAVIRPNGRTGRNGRGRLATVPPFAGRPQPAAAVPSPSNPGFRPPAGAGSFSHTFAQKGRNPPAESAITVL
jgi:hypothetical protein